MINLTDMDDAWRPRSIDELLTDQLTALDAWHRRAESALEARIADSREGRMDLRRRQEIHERERTALEARADLHLREEVLSLGSERPRAVLAHRQSWYRNKLAQELALLGVEVVASLEDGIEAAAAVILDQPDLLLIEDRLPGLTGAEVVDRAQQFSPRTVSAGQIAGPETMTELFGAGAVAVFGRRIPPADVAARLVECLAGQDERLSLV